MLHEVLDAVQLNQYDYFKDYDSEAFDMTLDAAKQIGDQHLFPLYREMDKKKAYYKDGQVHTHPKLKSIIKAIADGGWIAAHSDYEDGGQQMPLTLMNAGLFIFYAANANAAAYAFLTQGASNLLKSFASDELKQAYMPQMYNGDWQGTMALTEPQAGSSLTDITSTAIPSGNGHYKIKGQKIYISGGDHEACDNVVHLLLARIQGAPAGTKGISLFVVPKYRNENDTLVNNDVTTAGLYGKMGQKGYVAAHLMLGEKDDCHGYLVGAEHHGLPYMFQMMNEARIATGMMAAATASGAYYAALQYANERPQGRHPSSKDATLPQVQIIEHADVRRMLLFQKAVVEGSLSLLLYCSMLADKENVCEGEEKEDAKFLLELLTPIAKSYPSEFGNFAVSIGMQCLGGAGYCDDFPLEQYYRDIRVNSIYEGTTGIHGMDLLGRKVMMAKGKGLKLFLAAVQEAIAAASGIPALEKACAQLTTSTKSLHELTMHLINLAMNDRPEVFLADATLYLEYFSHVTIAWQWLLQGHKAYLAINDGLAPDEYNFYMGKIKTMEYFFEYELPKIKGLHERLMSNQRTTLETEPAFIN